MTNYIEIDAHFNNIIWPREVAFVMPLLLMNLQLVDFFTKTFSSQAQVLCPQTLSVLMMIMYHVMNSVYVTI